MTITKPLGIRKERALLNLLRQVVVDAKMDRASFSLLTCKDSLPTRESEVTDFIKQRTRLYRESWIISPLEQAIKEIEEDNAA